MLLRRPLRFEYTNLVLLVRINLHRRRVVSTIRPIVLRELAEIHVHPGLPGFADASATRATNEVTANP